MANPALFAIEFRLADKSVLRIDSKKDVSYCSADGQIHEFGISTQEEVIERLCALVKDDNWTFSILHGSLSIFENVSSVHGFEKACDSFWSLTPSEK